MNLQELKSKIFEIVDPSNGQTIKENNALKHIGYDDEKDVVTLLVTMHKVGGNDETKFKRSLAKLVKIDEGHKGIKLEIEENRVFGSITKQPINFIGVISGKGGVGKSSVAANIAYRLMKKGYEKSEKYWYHFYLPFSHSHIYFPLCFKHKDKNIF